LAGLGQQTRGGFGSRDSCRDRHDGSLRARSELLFDGADPDSNAEPIEVHVPARTRRRFRVRGLSTASRLASWEAARAPPAVQIPASQTMENGLPLSSAVFCELAHTAWRRRPAALNASRLLPVTADGVAVSRVKLTEDAAAPLAGQPRRSYPLAAARALLPGAECCGPCAQCCRQA
jgi:hypothetical protein